MPLFESFDHLLPRLIPRFAIPAFPLLAFHRRDPQGSTSRLGIGRCRKQAETNAAQASRARGWSAVMRLTPVAFQEVHSTCPI
jgi:hypothetical protein